MFNSPFFCVMLLLPPSNLQRKENKWFYFVRSQLTSSKNSCKKRRNFKFLFYYIYLIAPIKNIKQNKGENILKCWFYETTIKILLLISKSPPPILLICRQNCNVDLVKPILQYTDLGFLQYFRRVCCSQSLQFITSNWL